MNLFNDLTRQLEDFVPLTPGKVKMYNCGPTVYDYFHLGNARAFATFDTLRRYLEYRGYDVTYVQNFTDIDDKMIQRAQRENTTVGDLAERFIGEYFRDADNLNIRRADFHPRATETIDEIVAMVAQLVDKGFAYEAEDGVYFDVARMDDYGRLSHHNLDELEEGASERLRDDSGKRGPFDFILWKKQRPGEPSWPSPWGAGRPGWHIECSAMVRKYLGETIDIHGGGQDLLFPHHENEIAQSESANGKPLARYWLHNGYINVDHVKMAKSTGNFFRVRDLTEQFDPMALRLFILGGHYRMPFNFSLDLISASQAGWQRIRTCRENLAFVLSGPRGSESEHDLSLEETAAECRRVFITAMDADLNTADALAAVFDLVRAINTAIAGTSGGQSLRRAGAMLDDLLDVLGLIKPEENSRDVPIPSEILALVKERARAKQERDFQKADRLRERILSLGFTVVDTPQGPKVTPAS